MLYAALKGPRFRRSCTHVLPRTFASTRAAETAGVSADGLPGRSGGKLDLYVEICDREVSRVFASTYLDNYLVQVTGRERGVGLADARDRPDGSRENERPKRDGGEFHPGT